MISFAGAEPELGSRRCRGADVRDFYEFRDVVGLGAFSVVRSAEHRQSGAVYAVKSSGPWSDADREDAHAEVAILAQLNHDSVLRLHDCFEGANGEVHIVTDYVPGRDLLSCLIERGSYAEEDCRVIMANVLSALEHLHSNGIGHRDLKADNVVLGEGDDIARLKLVDFGLAKQQTTRKPFFSDSCGTPAYAAPEILQKNPRYGTSCDIWSAGVLLYLLLCGELPFESKTMAGLGRKIRTCDYSMSDPAWELVSDDAKSLVKELLTIDPTHRPTAGKALRHPWLIGQ